MLAGIAILAALGCERLIDRARPSPVIEMLVVATAVALACIEYHSPQRNLWRDTDLPVYRFIRQLPDGVVLELPLPTRSGDAGLGVQLHLLVDPALAQVAERLQRLLSAILRGHTHATPLASRHVIAGTPGMNATSATSSFT